MSGYFWQSFKKKYLGRSMVIVLVIIIIFIFRGPLTSALSFIQTPLVSAGTWVTNQTLFLFNKDYVSVSTVIDLENKLGAMASDQAKLELLIEENKQLKEQLAFLQRKQAVFLSAAITSRISAGNRNNFTIDRGSDDGLVIGSPVIVGEGILVGKISALTKTAATVTSITDNTLMTAVTLLNESRTIGLAEGMGGNLIVLRFIPHDQTVSVNDLIVTSGLEDNIPSGLLLGIVNTVRPDPTAPFQEAIVEPLADIARHHIVSVITDTN
ncbi:rod shape-determining protein MreC [Patescibacteria group bacterium]